MRTLIKNGTIVNADATTKADVLVDGGLGLFGGWFLGSYAASAIGWLVSSVIGPGNWLWSVAVLCGTVGGAVGAHVGIATALRAVGSTGR